MPKFKSAKEVFESNVAEGHINIVASINREKIKSLVANANTFVSSANLISKSIKKNAP